MDNDSQTGSEQNAQAARGIQAGDAQDTRKTDAPDYARQLSELQQRLAEQSRKMEHLSATVKDREEKLAAERRLSALRAAVAKVDWFDAEDAVRELAGQVREQDGRCSVAAREIVAGVEVERRLSLEEAVSDLARRKAHWVRARPSGGSGATGGTSFQPAGSAREVSRKDLREGRVDPAEIIAGKVRVVA
ncbi:MAG: hypothetical protein ABSE73_08410 [Planctomycetota bacterium]